MKIAKVVLIVLASVVTVLFAIRYTQKQFFTDITPPVITCDSDVIEVSVRSTDDKLLAGVTATDDVDGDITENVLIKSVSRLIGNQTAKITYIVFDSSDNMATLSREIKYTDYEKPHFKLTKPLLYNMNETVVLKDRLFANDVIDGDISSAIKVTTSALGNTVEGFYHLTVQVTNSLGDTTVLPLTVIIYSPSSYDPCIELTDYLVYLDQGDEFDPMDYVAAVYEKRYDTQVISDFSKVTAEHDVDTSRPGEYTVIYGYENNDGYTYYAVQTVVVE